MARLDIQRQKDLTPVRYKYALQCFKDLNLDISEDEPNKCIIITYKGCPIRFYPYSGWATGKSIRDCRGIRKLLKQVKL